MSTITCLSLALLFSTAAWADDEAARGKLMGSWQMDAQSVASTGWSFSPQGDSVKVVEVESGNKVADFVCGTNGSPCEVKIGGKKANVSLWYNGPKLVELEQRGSDTIERKFTIAQAADQMEVEVLQMAPESKSEKLKFKRAAASK